MLIKLIAVSLLLAGCASRSTYNIIDMTEDQWITNEKGERCIEKQMIITPDTINYYYGNCAITRIVKPKVHPLPKPKAP